MTKLNSLIEALKKERERAKRECTTINYATEAGLAEYRWWAGYAIGLNYAIRELESINTEGEIK